MPQTQKPPDLDVQGRPLTGRPPDIDPAGPPASAQPMTVGEHAIEGLYGLGRNLNPVTAAKGMVQAVNHPYDTVVGDIDARAKIGDEAFTALKSGDYVTGLLKLKNWLVPLVGPWMEQAEQHVREGKTGEGIGEALGIGASLFGPGAIKSASGFKATKAGMKPPTPNARVNEAVQFGRDQGVPIDAGTATNSQVVRTIQKRASDSLGGAGVAEDFKGQQAHALTRVGEGLAEKTSPTAVSPEQAGQAVRDAVSSKAAQAHSAANTAYDALRAFEERQGQRIANVGGVKAPATSAKPFTDVPLAVDVAPTKAAMQPIYEALKREAELVPLMGDKARALTSLDRLMQAPDMAPLSVADAALSEIKALARVDEAFRRTSGQGVAAQTVKSLDQAVVNAAKQGGPDVLKALMDGRSATISKHGAIAVLDKLRTEPVQVFQQATFAKDAGVGLLRQAQKLAPKEMAQIGRAYLDQLLSKATAEGGFERAQGLQADWQKLGPATKQILFKDATLIRELDNFFLLAKKLAENPNPSGTARVLTAFNLTAALPSYAVAKLAYSPRGVRLLTQGLQIPKAAAAVQRAWRANVANVLGSSRTTVPATAEEESPTAP